MHLVRVACSLEELTRREKARGDRCPGSAAASAQYLFPKDTYDVTVDTGKWTVSQCTEQILAALQAL